MKKPIYVILLFCVLLCSHAHAKLPFVVKVIYFQPSDAPEPPAFIAKHIKGVQQFYKDELERNGFEPKTFRIETDGNNAVVVHVVKGKGKSWEYANNTTDRIKPELPAQLKARNNIYVIFVGKLKRVKGVTGYGYATYGGICGGLAVIAAGDLPLPLSIVAHELGHAFGLYHNLTSGKALMGVGDKELDHFEARWLDKHHYFNDVHEINDVPEVVRVHKLTAFKDRNRDMVRLKAVLRSRNELHQVQLVRDLGTSVIGWSKVTGKSDSVDIAINRSVLTGVNNIYLQVLDTQGNHWIHRIPVVLPRPVPDLVKAPELPKISEPETNEPRWVTLDRKLPVLWVKLKR